MLFVCEPPPLDTNAIIFEIPPSSSSSSTSSSSDVVISEANVDVSSLDKMEEEDEDNDRVQNNTTDNADGDKTDNEEDEDLVSSSSSSISGSSSSCSDELSVRKLFAKARDEACHKARASKESTGSSVGGGATTTVDGSGNAKRLPSSSRVLKASTFEESTWTIVSTPNDLKELVDSLVPAPAYCDEARLRSVLLHLEPKLVESMQLGHTSPSEGLLGAICSQCYAQTDEVLLCDGPVAPDGGNGKLAEEEASPCPEEWCFKCAGVTEMPEGDWRCATCARS